MGAMAISTLAGSLLIVNAPDAPFLRSLLPFIKGFTVFYWATGTWWIPMLAVLGAAQTPATHHSGNPAGSDLRHRCGGRDRVKKKFSREQRMTIVYGILCVVLLLVMLQLWLLMATMNAFLGGDESVIWPAALASLVCLGLNVGLLWYLYAMERT